MSQKSPTSDHNHVYFEVFGSDGVAEPDSVVIESIQRTAAALIDFCDTLKDVQVLSQFRTWIRAREDKIQLFAALKHRYFQIKLTDL